MALTVAERTIVSLAMRLPGRISDIALAGTLPILALEVAVREATRVMKDRSGASRVQSESGHDLFRSPFAEPTTAE